MFLTLRKPRKIKPKTKVNFGTQHEHLVFSSSSAAKLCTYENFSGSNIDSTSPTSLIATLCAELR